MPGVCIRTYVRVCYLLQSEVLRIMFATAGLQGTSQAGKQGGLTDGRSGLIREVFNVFDKMPNGFQPQD